VTRESEPTSVYPDGENAHKRGSNAPFKIEADTAKYYAVLAGIWHTGSMRRDTMSANIMQQGIDLMLFGMGSVFVFLTLLVIAVNIMSAFIQKFLPVAPEPEASPVRIASAGVNDPKLIAIIKAAIDQHRSS